ncbi:MULTISPECIES: hypothetical protein [Pseudomonas]|uniref:hypothetical protein n=1 Tax=Pseudomonas TaxID=286 RepID=UPI000375869F|nr:MULTISPECIES: hypothetical protein [Pseudomonas]
MSNYESTKFQAVNWANEAIRIGNELIGGSESTPRMRSVLDEHFFLTSITMLNRICKYISENSPDQDEVKAAVDFFDKSTDARDVRNKREHFDEYIDGNHKRQAEFVVEKNGVSADLTSAYVDEHGYHLGNKATIQVLIKSCEDLLTTIKSPW